jgi:hypothetical protein
MEFLWASGSAVFLSVGNFLVVVELIIKKGKGKGRERKGKGGEKEGEGKRKGKRKGRRTDSQKRRNCLTDCVIVHSETIASNIVSLEALVIINTLKWVLVLTPSSLKCSQAATPPAFPAFPASPPFQVSAEYEGREESPF